MKTLTMPQQRLRGESGSVLVVCMVLAAIGTIGVAAWFSLVDARSHQVEASMLALERRVATENGRALAHRAFYSKYLHGNEVPTGDLVYELPGGKGRATIRAFSTVPLTSNTAAPPSRSGATPLTSHSTDVVVEVGEGSSVSSWTYRLRNYHPVAAGNLLTIHPPVELTDASPLVSGNLWIKGRAVFWDAVANDLKSGIRAEEFLLPAGTVGATTLSTPADVSTLPLNYPNYLRTTGNSASGPAYRGESELISATVNPQNSYEVRLQTSSTARLEGDAPISEGRGAPTIATQPGDATLITFVNSNPPQAVADELSKQNSLTSPVLSAAIHKANPTMSNQHFLQIFDAQMLVPDDALTEMMANLDEDSLDDALDMAIIDMNIKNEAQFNSNGKGKVQLFLDRPEITQVVVKDVKWLRLFGQPNATKAAAAALLPPLLLCIDNRGGEALARIDLFHENQRPLIVVIASAPTAPSLPEVSFRGGAAYPLYRIIFDLQDTGLAFDLQKVAGAKILGGIRCNHRVSVAHGTLTLDRDPNVSVLVPLLSRDAWIETVRN